MIRQIFSIVRRVAVSMRAQTPSRRSTALTALALEERATPAVTDGFTLPATIHLAPLNHEANVRADLFGSGYASAPIQPPVEEEVWFLSLSTPKESTVVYQETETAPQELKLTVSDAEIAA